MTSKGIIEAAERAGLFMRDFVRWIFDNKPAVVAFPLAWLILMGMCVVAVPLAILAGVLRIMESK